MSSSSLICERLLRSPRFSMDSTDEPQKKIFKARKTMKVSDRQQLEVVYKVKEDFRLLNGRHENGDSDILSLNDTPCMEGNKELTGMLDVCVDASIRNLDFKEATSETMESGQGNQVTHLNTQSEPLPIDENICDVNPSLDCAKTDQILEQNSTASNGTQILEMDQRGGTKDLLCGQEQINDVRSVKATALLSDQSVEHLLLDKQPENTELHLGEDLTTEDEQMVGAQLVGCMTDAQILDQQPLEEPPKNKEGQVVESQLRENVVEPAQLELLEELPEEMLVEETQQSQGISVNPGLEFVSEETGMAVVEDMLDEVEIKEPPLKEYPKPNELDEQVQPEKGHVEMSLLQDELSQGSQLESKFVQQRSEEELTEDQLLEELAEEKQFGEELAEDHLLDELAEDKSLGNVQDTCKEQTLLLSDEQVVSKGNKTTVTTELNEEKLEFLENNREKEMAGVEKPQVMEGQWDLTANCPVMVENKETEKVVEMQETKENFEQITEEKHGLMEKTEDMESSCDVGDKVEEIEEGKVLQENDLVEDAGETAISSSMQIDQESRVEKIDFPQTSIKPLAELQNGCDLENSDAMETDDIIPILEKLAPVEDGLNSFSKPLALSEVGTGLEQDDKVELSESSSSKQQQIENLPSEAFLVLSDEEDAGIEEIASGHVPLKHANATEKEEPIMAAEELLPKRAPNDVRNVPERSEVARRKRSKSEDLDGAQSKRRRHEGEDYEAELQVKFTARADVDQKLQKVVQRLLEEKLCALQCAVFDKTLADLKTRVEKLECKKHESVLNGIQAKIARLSKRFGAAKEDLKKRQETQVTQPVQAQLEPPGKAAGDGVSILAQRNVGTVRQMLDTKRTGDTNAPTFQAPASSVPQQLLTQPPPLQAAPNQALQRIAPTPSSQALTVATPARPMPDWKLIQQRINATHLASPQSKSQTPVTSTQVMTPVLSSPTTATVVGSNQVTGGSGAPMSVSLQSLQSLPVILHVPVMQSTMQNATVMQSTTGTLVTNQQSGNMEFIPSQTQANAGNLNKTPVSLTPTITTKPNISQSLPSPTMQRNSPASASSSGPVLSVHAVTTAHSVIQAARTSLPTVSTSGQYTASNSRTTVQMKVPVSSFTSPMSSEPTAAPRADIQLNRTLSSDPAVAKRAAESTTQGAKPGGGVIDLTLDEDEGSSSHDSRKGNQINISGISQPPQMLPRTSQPPQTTLVQQNTMPAGLPAQTTIHVLPTAQTTVNVNHRPMSQTMPRLSGPRMPTNHQVVYTTLPSTPIQSPVRSAVMQGPAQGLRQISPQTGGVTVRMPQTAYVVNNGMNLGSGGPQLTVHHRPPQEPLRTIHPAPLPEAPQPQRLPPEAASTSPPQKPHLKLARVQSQNGIVLSWSVLEVDRSCASVDSYHLYAYHEDPTASTPSQWKKIGEVKALPLPMACTLTQFVSGSKYYFAVRAKDVYGRFGVFCDPQSTDVIATQNS
ncbi:activating transcription factor 7-interacting protein 1 isoform X2 [Ambystoma mexicanum]|uniref:activating transcription factor 7-interacting protein 1 isoform X2 n=1 Tax=Ambystoma mexicanum TaxID=8296 RepID=UPI0037E9B554